MPSLLSQVNDWARRSVMLKVLAIVFLTLLLLIPAAMLGDLIRERQQARDSAGWEVSDKWGGAQTLSGPFLSVPYLVSTPTSDGRDVVSRRWLHLLPDSLDYRARLEPEVRQRGIYEVVLYRSVVDVAGRFDALPREVSGVSASALRWDEAVVTLGIADNVGIREPIRLRWGGATASFEPGVPSADVVGAGVSAPVAAAPGASIAFSTRLALAGSEWIGFAPFGRVTTAEVRAPWSAPSFGGSFLPEERTVADTAFAARWRVLHLNRNYGQAFTGELGSGVVHRPSPRAVHALVMDEDRGDERAASFGVRLLLPLDEYRQTMRAAKYDMVFILLVFVVFFFVEVLGTRRIHPIQYLLVGLAISLFYLMLLALSEHMPFDAAYGLSALAVLVLLRLYLQTVFRDTRVANVVAGLLAVVWVFFYVLLQLEDYALLLGSLALFVILAGVMYLSRQVDWYDVGARSASPPQAP